VTLTLEIVESSESIPRGGNRHVFGEDGGSIGRAATNSWVLAHNKVSGQHAQITYRNGVFYIQDLSRNGVSVNSPDNRLARNRPYALKPGDRIFIEPYEIDVWIEAPARSVRPAPVDPFGDDDPFAPRHDALMPLRTEGPSASPVSDDVDPLKFFDPLPSRPSRKPEPPVSLGDDLGGMHYQPPAALPDPDQIAPRAPAVEAIPAGYDPLRPDDPVVVPAPPPPPPPSPPPPVSPPIRPRPGDTPEARRKARDSSPGDSTIRQQLRTPVPPTPPVPEAAPPPPQPAAPLAEAPPKADVRPAPAAPTADLAELLAGAGVPDAAITPELSRNLGQILRIVVSGLMDVLQSRQRIKEEFRMQQTMFRPADNNPLKFSANLDDALHNLLVKRNAAYLNPVDAFADAFDDLRDHQLAMLEGMRVAFEGMLAEFDADRLQEEFDAQIAKHSIPLLPAKMRYWELYRDKRQAMVKDPEAAFARLFGEEFSRAYEEQFRKLKATRRTRG
jgi:type VI secretion system FHA domain protein